MFYRFLYLLPLLILIVCADEDLSESEILDKLFKFYDSDDITFFRSAPEMVSSFLFLAREQLELAENLNSTEPDLMGKFKVFNMRLKERSQDFRRLSQKVDGENTRLKLTAVINLLEKIDEHRMALLNSGDPSDLDLIKKFDDAFNESMVISDALFRAFHNKHVKGDQLFQVGVKVLHRHPRLSRLFMRGCVEVMLHAFVLEATRLQLTEQPEDKIHAFDKRSKKRLALVTKRIFEINKRLGENIRKQIELDQLRFHKELADWENCDFSKQFVSYLSDKYPHLSCFVFSYEPVGGSKYHSVHLNAKYGSALFRVGERNSVVDCKDRKKLYPNFTKLGRKVLRGVKRMQKARSQYAQKISNAVIKAMMERDVDHVTVMVVSSDAQSCYQAPLGHTSTALKKTYRCKMRLCWSKKVYKFNVVLFG